MSLPAVDVGAVADWLGTFAVHSTLALAAALALVLAGRRWPPVVHEALLRTSLWVALVSSTLQCALVGCPDVSELVLPGPLPAAAVSLPAATVIVDAGAPALVSAAEPWWRQVPWSLWLTIAAALSACGGLCWLLVVHRRLARVLAVRRPETDARVLATAAAVARESGLRQSPQLSRSDRIATPIAFGLLRPEICLPPRVDELGDGSLRAMLAHEVAHLRAADPAWMWAAAWLQALFPWQPLLLLVRRRWVRAVELRCDAVAARHAGPTAVARCLLDVADWLRPPAVVPAPALGMAARPSALRERVEAALHAAPLRPLRRRHACACGGLWLAALTFGAPGVVSAPPDAIVASLPTDEPSAAPAAATAPSPPRAPRLLRAQLALLQTEHDQLLAEAERLRAELADRRPDPVLEQLEVALVRRLSDLARLRARLEALLARPDPVDRDHRGENR